MEVAAAIEIVQALEPAAKEAVIAIINAVQEGKAKHEDVVAALQAAQTQGKADDKTLEDSLNADDAALIESSKTDPLP